MLFSRGRAARRSERRGASASCHSAHHVHVPQRMLMLQYVHATSQNTREVAATQGGRRVKEAYRLATNAEDAY